MRSKNTRRVITIALLVLAMDVTGRGASWAQQAPAPAPVPADDRPVVKGMAAVAAAVGTFFYIPFKALGICPGMVLASGVSLAVTGGDKAKAEHLLRVGCTGTYLITPEMVRGQEEFQGSGTR